MFKPHVIILILFVLLTTGCTTPVVIKIAREKNRGHIPSIFIPTYDINDHYEPVFDPADFPNADNTGIKGAGLTLDDLYDTGSLHVYYNKVITGGQTISGDDPMVTSGRITITESEIIIERLNIDDGVYINDGVERVIIRQCRITRGTYGVTCKQNSKDVLIEYCTFTNAVVDKEKNEDAMRKAILAKNCVISRCDISNYADGIYLTNNVTVKDCYIHDAYHYDPVWDDETSTEDSTHSDGIQTSGGGNYFIRHNTIDGTDKNSAIMFTNHYNDIGAIFIDNNYLIGGNYTLYIVDSLKEPYIISDVLIRNNVFQQSDHRRAIGFNQGDITFIGNIFDSGEKISIDFNP